ncbi:MAG: magnesium/cobalt transporter CorA [Armatimonadia bacterium]
MAVKLTLLQYDADSATERELAGLDEVPALLEQPKVLWLHVQGEPDEELLAGLAGIFHLHPLATEDVVTGPQRPKAEEYEEQDFIVTHIAELGPDKRLSFHQFSFFAGKNYVLSFYGGDETVTAAVRTRIHTGRGTIRQHGVDYLLYALLDAIVDSYFPVLEDFGEYLEYVQERALLRDDPGTMREIQRSKHELLHLRRVIWPVRDLLTVLMRDDNNNISHPVRQYLRDCYDHIIQLMDMTETYREMAADLMDAYMSAISNRMNSIMKVLTIIATLFMPLTFIVGLYGMNFNTKASSWNMPELNWRYGYPFTWAVMIVVVVIMLVWFRRRGWIGRSDLPCVEDLEEGEAAGTQSPGTCSRIRRRR